MLNASAKEFYEEAKVQGALKEMYIKLEMYDEARFHQAYEEVNLWLTHVITFPNYAQPANKLAENAPDDAGLVKGPVPHTASEYVFNQLMRPSNMEDGDF